MSPSPLFLGIDTSNYTTSAAIVAADGTMVANSRKLLEVKQGEKGLRQSDALFQHWNALPVLLQPLLSEYGKDIAAVCAGNRPRPVEGSYMPVFTAGTNLGKTLAAALGAQFFELSHQEGHFLAASYESETDFSRPVICAHLSGGTLELVLSGGGQYRKIGGTKDISYGQIIDRTGVDLGLSFPAGRAVDDMACSYAPEGLCDPLCRVFTDKTYLSLFSWPGIRVLSELDNVIQAEIPYFGDRSDWLIKRICACGGAVTTDDENIMDQARALAKRLLEYGTGDD
jgi:N6-L-threonylcarbamoyladenine synthase